MLPKRHPVPITYIRGGTSKAVFFHEHDIPPPGPLRDRLLRRVMGSPDPMQIDGMGGTHIVTSKVAIIRPSSRNDADVDYTFAQVSVESETVDYDEGCGNISAGVGPFAIDEGLVKEEREGLRIDPTLKTREVRFYHTGTKRVLIAHVPIDPETGGSLEQGNFAIAGCPGTGAPILLDYRSAVGGALDRGLLPTGNTIDETTVYGKRVRYTLCDVANITVFAHASDLGLTGSETPSRLTTDKRVIAAVKELRGKAAERAGMCQNWENVDVESPILPFVALISSPTHPECQIQSRLFLDNKCHTSMAGTGGSCTAACSRIPGSVVHELMNPAALKGDTFTIQHPMGSIPISIESVSDDLPLGQLPEFKTLSFVRTARRILDGHVYVPRDLEREILAARQTTNGV